MEVLGNGTQNIGARSFSIVAFWERRHDSVIIEDPEPQLIHHHHLGDNIRNIGWVVCGICLNDLVITHGRKVGYVVEVRLIERPSIMQRHGSVEMFSDKALNLARAHSIFISGLTGSTCVFCFRFQDEFLSVQPGSVVFPVQVWKLQVISMCCLSDNAKDVRKGQSLFHHIEKLRYHHFQTPPSFLY
jgi:hypothetical protein